MIRKIKIWIQKQLGIAELERQYVVLFDRQKILEQLISTLSSGVVDVHFKSPSQIYIVSKLGDGYFTQIDVDCSYNDLIDVVRDLKHRFGNPGMIWDDPPAYKKMAQQMRIEKGL